MTGLGCMALGAEGCVDPVPWAVMFPGQGSQTVGMDKWVFDASPAAREVYALADQIVGWPLSRLCLSGSESALIRTQNIQPALFVTCLATYATIDEIIQIGYQEER